MEAGRTNKDFFETFGLELVEGEVEVGKSYPIFGVITKLAPIDGADLLIELNYSIKAVVRGIEVDKIELLKQRAFESGIFVSKILAKEPELMVECQTIIFGKPQAYNA